SYVLLRLTQRHRQLLQHLDFSDLKKIVKTNITDPLDHALILPSDTSIRISGEVGQKFCQGPPGGLPADQ
ncbi:MAG: hypothetical protein MZV63_10370, partial [Marinilabiliales bacterium]|nr:hypothetical protein [Marinilabiliales bacterium]